MTLQDKLIAKIKEYFPDIKIVTMVDSADLVKYGMSREIKKGEKPEYEYVHMVMRSECDHNLQTEESAENDLMGRLNYLNTCKAPDVILIRFCETGRDYASASNGAYVSKARFSLGYKI